MIITRKAAKKLFKEENPVGKTIKIGESGTFTITGVLKDINKKSHIVFDALCSMATVPSLEAQGKLDKDQNSWNNYWNTWTYVLLEDGKEAKDIESHLDKIFQKNIAPNPNPDIIKARFAMQALMDITPGHSLAIPLVRSYPGCLFIFSVDWQDW